MSTQNHPSVDRSGPGRRAGALLLLSAVVALAGCPTSKDGDAVRLELSGVEPSTDYAELSKALAGAVGRSGMVIRTRSPHWAAPLDEAVKRLAVTGPTASPKLFSGDGDKLAYWYNLRAAWSLKLAQMQDVPDTLDVAAMEARAFPADGRTMTLQEVDRQIESIGGWRAVVAAPGVSLQRAALPPEAFTGQGIDQQVEDRFNQFIADGRRFVIDVEARQVRIPPVLWQYAQSLTQEHARLYGAEGANFTTVLLPLTRGLAHRRLQAAIGLEPVPARPAGILAVLKDQLPPLW